MRILVDFADLETRLRRRGRVLVRSAIDSEAFEDGTSPFDDVVFRSSHRLTLAAAGTKVKDRANVRGGFT
ncbi:MAG TPA: hypothetical protein VHM89_09185 [Acidimicrobiales bacterium]|nr:hypothetical protein [Acidimicrobiales bacterium]